MKYNPAMQVALVLLPVAIICFFSYQPFGSEAIALFAEIWRYHLLASMALGSIVIIFIVIRSTRTGRLSGLWQLCLLQSLLAFGAMMTLYLPEVGDTLIGLLQDRSGWIVVINLIFAALEVFLVLWFLAVTRSAGQH